MVRKRSSVRKRPCRVCRRWFRPHPRAGDRQKVCDAPKCQRERHRRSCSAWNSRESVNLRRERFRKAIRSPAGASEGGLSRAENGRLAWDVIQDAVSLEASVIAEEVSKLIKNV